jgi:tetratricopeptide (TPR) repeat protein
MFFSFTEMSYAHIAPNDDYKKSIVESTQAIKNNPNDSEAYCKRGSNYAGLGMDELALADLNKAIEIYAKAIEVYAQMKSDDVWHLQVGYANLLTARAHIYIEQRKYDLAVNDFTTAIKVFNHNNDNLYVKERAEVYYLMGEYDKAIEDYDRSIIYNKYWVETISKRGDVYTKKGDYDKALEDYNTALHFVIFPGALMGRANVYAHYQQNAKAIADYSDAINCCETNYRNDSLCAQAYYLRGKIFFEQGEYYKTVADCDKAIKLKLHYIDAQQLKDKALP